MKIAALYVQKNGCYFGLPGVDPWDEARDARLCLEIDRPGLFDPGSEWFAIIAAVDRDPQYNLYMEGMNCDEGD